MKYNDLVEKVSRQWKDAEMYFEYNNYQYTAVSKLKEDLEFYNWLFQVLDKTLEFLEFETKKFKVMYRAVKEEKCDYKRFIPSWKYATENRMNGVDKLYIYLGTNFNNSVMKAKYTCQKEIRAENGDCVSFLKFELSNKCINSKVINLCKDWKLPENEVDYVKYMKKYYNQYGKKGIEIVSAKILINFLADSCAFDPIDRNNNSDYKHKYVPFWAITDYLEFKGYLGVIYNSTVDKSGVNLALFDVNCVEPVGKIETVLVGK